MANYWNLREANVARDIEWTGGAANAVSFTFRAAELHGEAAEVMDIFIADPDNPSHDDAGEMAPVAWLNDLRDELADGFITVDLTAMKLGFPEIPVDEETARPEMLDPYRAHTIPELLTLLGRATGRICNTLKKLEREANGWVGSRADKYDAWPFLFEVHVIYRLLAERYGFDPAAITSAKFNATSEKNGLTTRLLA